MKGFAPIKSDTGTVAPWEYQPCGAMVPKVGMAMKFESGKLAKAGAADAPEYICMCERESTCEDGESIPVVRVNAGTVYETECSAESAAVNLGDLVQLDESGMCVSATTGGKAEIVGKEGNEAGSTVRVRFPGA